MSSVKELFGNILNMIEQNKCPHAIVIESETSSEIEAMVKNISKALICTSKEKKPCGKCSGCKKFPNHPDLKEVMSTGVTKSFSVEAIREIRQDANVIPNEANCKVYLFLDADNFTIPAQNAFLKLLEEPPANVYFILTVKSSTSLLSTVLSRVTLYHVSVEAADVYEDSVNIAKEIFNASSKSSECDLMFMGGKILDRDTFTSVVDELERIYAQALREIASGEVKGDNLDEQKVLEILDVLRESRRLFQRNVNLTLLVTWMLIEIREKIFVKYKG